MPSNANGYDSIFPYPLDKEDIEYLQMGVQSIFKEMCCMNNDSWSNQCHTHSPKIPQCEKSHGLNCTSSEHNYHLARGNSSSELQACYENGRVCKKEDFPMSQSHASEKLFSDILNKGIDEEDMAYLKQGFNIISWDCRESWWSRQLHWIPHPTTSDDATSSQSKHTEELGHLPFNKSGCARTEGYLKRIQKYSKMQAKYKDQQIKPTINISALPYSKTYKGNKQTLSRDARNDQRRLLTAYQTITHSNLLNLNELKFRKKKLMLGKSDIHGLGLFAGEPIGPNEIIIEYVGQIIRPIIADLRENGYKQSGLGHYCFLIDDGTVIDATKYGNINRYINHSCDPNSYAKILVINNQKKIVIYSKRHIKADEEITYDYKMKIEDEKIECLCKAPGCKKTLN